MAAMHLKDHKMHKAKVLFVMRWLIITLVVFWAPQNLQNDNDMPTQLWLRLALYMCSLISLYYPWLPIEHQPGKILIRLHR